ncbi:MAG: hypothetical protein ACXW07_08755 [Nitrososphaeraceae archaeon]
MDNEKFVTETHALWVVEKELVSSVERQIDEILHEFLCYPDFEWAKYEIRPPENLDLIGSWRDKNGETFVFLLRNAGEFKNSAYEYLVIVVGFTNNVSRISGLIKSHKCIMHAVENKELKRKEIAESLKEESSNKSIESFSKLVGIFTILINAFSLYLRDLPAPTGMSSFAYSIYSLLVSLLHLAALVLLLLILSLAVFYVSRYGYMMLRRMK